ncbi:hypothetical protein CBR_g20149 [Chara braunii]|uniref:Uncharacterized protein n=1 Tax=Chara braunii TaxID=69332 RepID=A0A388KZS4_CHABU|nr:hypothetical protein CBR_g20149 [Chara braunii]|eukprot:GBG75518.1 hypothetical protein CBR_g20149 [Chara braunii]
MPIAYDGDDEDRTRTSELSTDVATEGATGGLDPNYVPEQQDPSSAYEESEPEGEAVERRYTEGTVVEVARAPVSAINEPSPQEGAVADMAEAPVSAMDEPSTRAKTTGVSTIVGCGCGAAKGWGDGEDDKEKVVDLDVGYFLEWKEGIKKDVTLPINPERVLELPAWERPYNHRLIDPTRTAYILQSMMDAFKKKGKTYEKPILKLTPIAGLPSPGRKVVRVTPDKFNVENPNEHWYDAVSGQHNVKAALELRNHEIWEKHTFYDWPFKPLYFADEDFDGYTQISVNENRKDKSAPPRDQRLSMIDIR